MKDGTVQALGDCLSFIIKKKSLFYSLEMWKQMIARKAQVPILGEILTVVQDLNDYRQGQFWKCGTSN